MLSYIVLIVLLGAVGFGFQSALVSAINIGKLRNAVLQAPALATLATAEFDDYGSLFERNCRELLTCRLVSGACAVACVMLGYIMYCMGTDSTPPDIITATATLLVPSTIVASWFHVYLGAAYQRWYHEIRTAQLGARTLQLIQLMSEFQTLDYDSMTEDEVYGAAVKVQQLYESLMLTKEQFADSKATAQRISV